MGRVAIAILWMVIAGSAHAAYMKGTLTYDDGRTATLTLQRFVTGGGPNIINRGSRFRCSGDACFRSGGVFGFSRPFNGAYALAFYPGSPTYDCCTQDLGLKRPGACRITSRVVCTVFDIGLNQVVATGEIDVHRTTASCRRILRRAEQ